MTDAGLHDRYHNALTAWLQRDATAGAVDALALVREALTEGRGLTDLTAIHESVIWSEMAKLSTPAEIARCLARAEAFLTEVAASFEMTHRGWLKVVDRLHELNAALERQMAERTAALAASVRAQAALAAGEARLDRAPQLATIGSWEEDLATGAVFWSREMCRIRGLPPGAAAAAIGAGARGVDPGDAPAVVAWIADLKRGTAREPIECRLSRSDGEARTLRYHGTPVADGSGRITSIAGTLQDVTRRRLAEHQLVQAQTMAAIGTLTGGLAHDFNNLLAVIVGNLELLRDRTTDNPAADQLAGAALDAALQGADLTRCLLAFAGRQPLRPERRVVNDLVMATIALLRRTLGGTIDIAHEIAPDLWAADIDPVQLEAAIKHLVSNACDAMPEGGRMTVATRNVRLDEDYARRHADVTPGDYVAIELRDTGIGMTADVVAHIFEPFFTTKAQGKGSGLGLAAVFGFMRQSGGHIDVDSEPGAGSTFRLYLPRDRGIADPDRPEAHPDRGDGHEAILVVEDNAKLRAVAVKQLAALGYRVRAADNAQSALAILAQPEPIALLLTDVVMPGEIDGLELARRAVAQRPGLRVLLTSGFPRARAGAAAPPVSGHRLLSKPYRRGELARLVRETLDARRTDAPPGPIEKA